MKSAHLPKIEARRDRVMAILLPPEVTRQHNGENGQVLDPKKRLAEIITRVDSTERGAVTPNRTTRSDVEDLIRLLTVDVPELIDAVYEANSSMPRACQWCGERREGLLVRQPEVNRMECRDQDGCEARRAKAGIPADDSVLT
jgi:hypothetical protein